MSNLLGLEEEKPQSANAWPDAELGPDPELAAHVRNGANWFYWIAGLSIINSLIFLFGANVAFLAGLGFTQVVDAIIDISIQSGGPSALKAVAVVFDLVLVIMFALIGYYSNKRFTVAFIIGIAIYAFDSLLVLALGSFLPAGFHAFALFFIIRGFLACRKLNAFRSVQPAIVQPPPPPAFERE